MSSIYEFPNALERPSGSKIDISDSGNSVYITIPPLQGAFILKAVAVFATIGVIAFFATGLLLFVFHYTFVLNHDITESEFRAMSFGWRVFYVFGWLFMTGLSSYLIIVAVRPMTRREILAFEANGVILRSWVLGSLTEQKLKNTEIDSVHRRQDTTGMMSSAVIIRSKSESRTDSIEVGQSTTESEKQWLASVIAVLLKHYKTDPISFS